MYSLLGLLPASIEDTNKVHSASLPSAPNSCQGLVDSFDEFHGVKERGWEHGVHRLPKDEIGRGTGHSRKAGPSISETGTSDTKSKSSGCIDGPSILRR